MALSEDQRRLSIATLGPDEGHRLADRVSEVIANRSADCGHLTAAGVCAACGASPSARVKRSRVVVKDVFGSTLIEKQTCPTAISFWRWIAGKVAEIRSARASSICRGNEEWKRLALLAASCLLLGGVAAAADAFNHWTALGFYAAAYVCGGWDAAEDAWARFRQGRLDVHFLMLAVAAGASVIGAWREGALLLFLFSASGHGALRDEQNAARNRRPAAVRGVLKGEIEQQFRLNLWSAA